MYLCQRHFKIFNLGSKVALCVAHHLTLKTRVPVQNRRVTYVCDTSGPYFSEISETESLQACEPTSLSCEAADKETLSHTR